MRQWQEVQEVLRTPEGRRRLRATRTTAARQSDANRLALGEFGQSEILARLHTGLAFQSGEQARIGSLEDFDLTFDPHGHDPRELASRVKEIGKLEPAPAPPPFSFPPGRRRRPGGKERMTKDACGGFPTPPKWSTVRSPLHFSHLSADRWQHLIPIESERLAFDGDGHKPEAPASGVLPTKVLRPSDKTFGVW